MKSYLSQTLLWSFTHLTSFYSLPILSAYIIRNAFYACMFLSFLICPSDLPPIIVNALRSFQLFATHIYALTCSTLFCIPYIVCSRTQISQAYATRWRAAYLIGKLFSKREKDLADLRMIKPKIDKGHLTKQLLTTTTDLSKESTLKQAAQKNWYVLFGEHMPSS